VVATAGAARCWGYNSNGQTSSPADLSTITAITAGGYHSCAVTTAGTARCWGDNRDGQIIPPTDLGTITAITVRRNPRPALSW
jgi:alpha-tubulin suppressor-like RCC1 family protein